MPTNQTRSNLITESLSLFPDNNTQEISPADLREWLADGTTSFVTQKDKSTLENVIYEAKSSSIAAAGVTDLSTAAGNYIYIIATGTEVITDFGSCPAGARFILVFTGICTIQYNATSLIIPGLANKTTADGDACMIVSEGSGNWKIVGYFSISGSGGGSGTVTSITAGTGLTGGTITTSGTIALANTAVTPNSYTNANITVDAQGRITSASDGTAAPTSTVQHQVRLGENISKGQAVYVSSANGTNMIVSKASYTSEATSSKTMGIIDATGVTNDFVNVITEGLLDGIDTSAANAAGDSVWLGSSGNLLYGLANKPYAPLHMVSIGIVTRKSATNGEIFVKVQNGFELKELHDVQAQSPNSNDTIYFDSADGQWKTGKVTAITGVSRINATTAGVIITGTTAKTKTLSVLVPANTFVAGSVIQLSAFGIRTAGSTNGTMRIEANTTDAIGGTLLANYVHTGTNSWFKMQREFIISNSTTDTSGFPITASGVLNDNLAVVATIASNAVDWTIDQYIVVSMQNGNNADSTYCRAISILQK